MVAQVLTSIPCVDYNTTKCRLFNIVLVFQVEVFDRLVAHVIADPIQGSL